MAMASHLHHLFNTETCQSYLHTLRWKDRPLQCPRCQSHNGGPWGTYHAQPGLKRYRWKEQGWKKSLGRRPRGRRKKREPGRGHDDKDRPALLAWVSRQGAVVLQATRDFTVKTVQKAADLAMQAGSRLYTDSASSYRLITGYEHDAVNHTKKEYARGDVHENRAESLFSLLKPYLRVFRGISKCNLPGYVGFFQFLRNFRQHNACEQAELILQAALDPSIASRARREEFVTCFDHFDLLQTAIN